MKKQISESEIEKRLRDEIRNLGGLCFKWASPGNRGVPDRIVILKTGDVYFVELKTEIGRLSKIQIEQIRRLEKRHANVRVIYGMDGLENFMKEVRKQDAGV